MKRFLLIASLVLVVVLMGASIVAYRILRHPIATTAWLERRALVTAGFHKRVFHGPYGKLTYFEAGSGAPLIFLHGAGDQAGTWSQVAPAFVAKRRVLVLDQVGHSESDPSEGPLEMPMIVTGFTSFAETLGPQPATIVGNSLGAWVATLYAKEHPERVERIVLVNGGALRFELPVSLIPQNREEARRLMNALTDPSRRVIPDVVLDDVVRTNNAGPVGRLIRGEAFFERYFIEADAATFPAPVEILWGESDRLIPLDYARRMEAAFPAARLSSVPRCAHVPQRECAAEFQALLQKQLELPPPSRKELTPAPAAAEVRRK